MAENMNVDPTPIQRNRRDVAIELVKLFLSKGDYVASDITEDKLGELYKKYHQVACEADSKRY